MSIIIVITCFCLGISADLKIHSFSFEAFFSFETLATLGFQMKRTASNEKG